MDIVTLIVSFLLGSLVVSVFFLIKMGKASREKEELKIQLSRQEERILGLNSKQEEIEQISEELREENENFKIQISDYRVEIQRLQSLISSEKQSYRDRIETLSQMSEKMNSEFKVISADILESRSKVLAEENKRNLNSILLPFNIAVKDLKSQIQESFKTENNQRISLKEQIKHLSSLNQQIGEDAVNLTKALKGQNKIQGIWGEMILETLLEKSGLKNGIEFDSQKSFKGENPEERQIPDIIVHLPDKRDVIIDSKVSLTAYEALSSSADKKTTIEEEKKFIISIKNHIKELTKKDYQNIEDLQSLDFVLMFIPIEGAFSLILNLEPEIFNWSFEKNIILTSPTTLMVALRTIYNSWRFEQQSQNAREIARKAGLMYDKLAAFVEDMHVLDNRLEQTKKAYSSAMNKLTQGRGNLLNKAEELRQLGAITSKTISIKGE